MTEAGRPGAPMEQMQVSASQRGPCQEGSPCSCSQLTEPPWLSPSKLTGSWSRQGTEGEALQPLCPRGRPPHP